MLCYQDRTFCQAVDCAKFNQCDRALTEKVEVDAAKWWGKEGAPISVVGRFDCYEESNTNE